MDEDTCRREDEEVEETLSEERVRVEQLLVREPEAAVSMARGDSSMRDSVAASMAASSFGGSLLPSSRIVLSCGFSSSLSSPSSNGDDVGITAELATTVVNAAVSVARACEWTRSRELERRCESRRS